MLPDDNGGYDHCVCSALTEITVGEKQQLTDGSSQYENTQGIERCSDDQNPSGIHLNVKVVVSAGDKGEGDHHVHWHGQKLLWERSNNKPMSLVNTGALGVLRDATMVGSH